MAFTSIGSVEGNFLAVTTSSDTVNAAVPDLGTNRIGVVLVSLAPCASIASISGVTWNSVAMNEAAQIKNGSAALVGIFYLSGMADNGTYAVTVTYSSSVIHTALIAVLWADASGAVTLDDTSTGSGTTQNPAITSTQAGANELVVSASASDANGITVGSVTGATLLQDWDSGANACITAYSLPSASGDATHTHTYTQSGTYAIVSASFKEGAGAQSLTGETIASSAALTAPTVTPGAVTLTGGTLGSAAQLFLPTAGIEQTVYLP